MNLSRQGEVGDLARVEKCGLGDSPTALSDSQHVSTAAAKMLLQPN
jgi:hypothetical protein